MLISHTNTMHIQSKTHQGTGWSTLDRIILAALLSLFFAFQAIVKAERVSLDEDWQFALGHASDTSKDFNHATGYFSYLAKTGFGDGPASPVFDDRMWRTVDLPHDWAVEMPFDPKGSHSHGYKAVGPRFPENSVGWYRKSFSIDEGDLGKKIFVEFDGIYRDSDVFINGFFVGNEPSGYLGQNYDITDYLNYGGDNIVSVRVDASMEEGWFYEGAGIYRHAWLTKLDPLHLVKDGNWINPQKNGADWIVHMQTEVVNQDRRQRQYQIRYSIIDGNNAHVASRSSEVVTIQPGNTETLRVDIEVGQPRLWSVEDPELYRLETALLTSEGDVLESNIRAFGFRTVEWDPNKGFFLNGKHVKLKGSNNHQDHAGVGAAIPDGLQEWRLLQLKKMGQNAYRASHNPPTSELLDACDRLGILVIDETRLMGINDYHLSQLERLVRRDRNHPSVIMWSLGNEEWGIEGNIKGARITQTMQDFCHRLDPTRYTTVAISGGWGGVSHTVQAAGVNYIGQADPDKQHKEYPEQIILGTEETTNQQTRGIYFRDDERCHLPPIEDGSSKGNAEIGWKFYAERDYTAGVFYWTGFDYRGEPTPFGYPAIASQFGILDTCGFPKDGYYYLKSWWTDEPVLHVFPHWNWAGREGESTEVRVHSNCEKAELFLNGDSLGEQTMEVNGHLAWDVLYESGSLTVKATWADGTQRTKAIHTTGPSATIGLSTDGQHIRADRNQVSVVTVSVKDKEGRLVPTAEDLIHFSLEGPGKIIGVGNGNPSSLEPDVFVEQVWGERIGTWEAPNPADSSTPVVFEATFDKPVADEGIVTTLLLNKLGRKQKVTLNGTLLDSANARFEMDVAKLSLRDKGNTIRIEAEPFVEWRDREGLFQMHPVGLRFEKAAPAWKRKVFNGFAQVIIASNGEPGTIQLTAEGEGLDSAELEIQASR